jgi:tetratricopeptide (TPR) repeat protein
MSENVIILQLIRPPNGQGYLVQVMDSPAKASSFVPFKLINSSRIYRTKTLEKLKASIDDSTIGPEEIDALGEYLYKLLFSGDVLRLIGTVADQMELPYRLCIRVDKAPFLETVPWEYLREPLNGFLAHGTASITRVLDDREPRAFTVLERTRMLLAYANPENYLGDKEYQEIEQRVRRFIDGFVRHLEKDYGVEVTILDHVGEQAFLNALQSGYKSGGGQTSPDESFDIVHFIGHGVVRGKTNKGYLVLEVDNPQSAKVRYVPGEKITTTLKTAYNSRKILPPRLFYFNACSTAKAEDEDPFSSIAQVLLKPKYGSVPAVVAMQYEVGVADSLDIAEEFYDSLLDPRSSAYGNLEAAMDAARVGIYSRSTNNFSWGIPVLFMQTSERVTLFGDRQSAPPTAQLSQRLRSEIPSWEPTSIIDRAEEVSTIEEFLASERRVLIIGGLPGIGRSTVVRAAIDTYYTEGAFIIWLNLESLKSEEATLGTLYLSLNKIMNGKLQALWKSKQSLELKLERLIGLMQDNSIIVLKNIDALLDAEAHFCDKQVEQLFRSFARTERDIHVIATTYKEAIPEGGAISWQRMTISELTAQNAVALLKREGWPGDEKQLKDISTALGGYPQALKMITAAVKRGELSIEELLSTPQPGLKDANLFISENVLRVMSEEERRRVEGWSVFRNPVLKALLWEENESEEASSIIQSLVARKILCVQNDIYYSLNQPVRHAAYAELKSNPERLREAHLKAAYFFRERAYSQAESAVDGDEFANNLLEAYYHFRAGELRDKAMEMVEAALQPLMDSGRFRELEATLAQAVEDGADSFTIRIFQTRVDRHEGNYKNALDRLELECLLLEHGSYEHAIVVNEIGVVLKERSKPEDAEKMLGQFEEAYDLFGNIIKTSNDQEIIAKSHWQQATSMYNRGLIYQYYKRGTPQEFQDSYRKARELYEAARKTFETLQWGKDETRIVLVLKQLGELYADPRFEECDAAKAEGMLNEALAIAQRIGLRELEVDSAYQLARFLHHRQRTVEARAVFRRAADGAASIGLLSTQAMAEVQIAEIDFKANQYDVEKFDSSLAWCEEQLGYYDDAHSTRVQCDAYYFHGLLWLNHDDLNKARELFENSLQVVMSFATESKSLADAKRVGRAACGASEALWQQGLHQEARALIGEQQHYFQMLGNQLDEGQPLEVFLKKACADLKR